ncbi:MAG: hypothetical protein J6I64_01765 [Lachnospiraceae bacterium]|nr:hypothetical protein [Lachnospiraceae bacterium]
MTDTEGSMQWEDPWEKRFDTRVISQEYRDELGNSIVYYCCRTTYVEESQRNGSADHPNVDQRALEVVIDFDQASGHRDCKVGDWPAVLCEKDGRTYLCWTISPEYSCVIKYDAEAVAEEDIFRMAESVTKQ